MTETQKETYRVIIPVTLYDSLISYLIEKPYKEVGVLLPRLYQESQIIEGNSDDE